MTDSETLQLAEQVVELLSRDSLTLATAESCTGGLLAASLVRISGASEVFVGGVVAYSNRSKVEVLGVNAELIQTHGAVSHEVAEQMAEGARREFDADIAVSSTGIAGPTGGTVKKPVGTVFGHIRGPDQSDPVELHLDGGRHEVQDETVKRLLKALIRHLSS